MIKIILLINIFNIILKSSSFKYNIKQIIIIYFKKFFICFILVNFVKLTLIRNPIML